MPRHVVKATVTVDIEMSIEAESANEAREIFDGQLVMSASLTDMPKTEYDVYDDSISEMARVSAEVE